MKQLVCWMLSCWLTVCAFGQAPALKVTTGKTTSLVFPSPIRHVDRGSKDLLVQPVPQMGNILLVKAASKDFEGSNLSVVTSDGSVYAFTVNYDPSPPHWVYKLPAQSGATMEDYANRLLDNPATLRSIRDSKWGVEGSVRGMYIKGDVLYFQLEFANSSSMDYEVESFRFYVRDKKARKRTARQETELTPLQVVGSASRVGAGQRRVLVAVLPKFTAADGKYLAIEVMEKAGGRHLLLKVPNRKLLRAIPLPEYNSDDGKN